jgi:hypothetical protein
MHNCVADVSTLGSPTFRHASLNDSIEVPITMKIKWDSFAEVALSRILEMQMHMRSTAVAGVADTAEFLANRHAISDRHPYRAWL